MDTQETSRDFSVEKQGNEAQSSPDAQKKKLWLKELILCAVIAGLMLISSIFTAFLPLINISSDQIENYSRQLSSVDAIYLLVDVSTAPAQDNEITQKFLANGGAKLFRKINSKGEDVTDKEGETNYKIVVRSASEEQILNDVEYKRSQDFGQDLQGIFGPLYLSDILAEQQRIYDETMNGLALIYPSGVPNDLVEEMDKEVEEDKPILLDKGCAVIDLFPEEIAHYNFAGLGCFLEHAAKDYEAGILTGEKLDEYEAKYLVGTYDNETELKALFEDDMRFITYLPRYTTNFSLINGTTVELSFGIKEETCTGSYQLYMFFGIALTAFALVQLLYVFPPVLRLIRLLRHQPRKVPKKKQKLGAKYITTVLSLLILIPSIALHIINAVMEAGRFTCAFPPVLVLTLLINVLIIVGDVMYHIHVKNNPEIA